MSGSSTVRSSSPSEAQPSSFARHRVPASVTESHVDGLLAALDRLLDRDAPFAIVVELDDAIGITAPLRRKLAVALDARSASMRKHCAALAFVAKTPGALGVHTALRWLTPAACSERVFMSSLEADEWAKARLAAGASAS